MIAAGFSTAREAMQTLRDMPRGQRIIWFEGRLAIEAHRFRDLRCVVELLNFLAFRSALECCQMPLGDPEDQKRAWRHYVARTGDVGLSEGLLAAVVAGKFTAGKKRVEIVRPTDAGAAR